MGSSSRSGVQNHVDPMVRTPIFYEKVRVPELMSPHVNKKKIKRGNRNKLSDKEGAIGVSGEGHIGSGRVLLTRGSRFNMF